jgi:hypothetical protein
MTRPTIPRFEPEVIAAGARKSGVSKGATTGLKRLMIHGVTLMSQMPTAHEYELTATVLDALPSACRSAIESVRCGATTCYIELRRCDPTTAAEIAQAFKQAFADHDIVINGQDIADLDFTERQIGMPWSRPPGAR